MRRIRRAAAPRGAGRAELAGRRHQRVVIRTPDLSDTPEYQLMASVRTILAYLDRLETVAPVELGDILDGCVLVGIATDPIDDVVYPTHSTPAGRTGQFADIGFEFSGAQIAEQ